MSSTAYQFSHLVNETYNAALKIAPLLTGVIGVPRTAVDLGGGGGGWLKAFQDMGTEKIFLIEHPSIKDEELAIPKENLILCDFEHEVPLPISCDLAISTEFAEHIRQSNSDMIVDFLTKSAPIVLFSAAIPGQTGCGHINLQRSAYWQNKFEKRDYKRCDFIRKQIIFNQTIPYWFRQNIQLYIHQDIEQSILVKMDELQFIPDEFEIVHVDILNRQATLRELSKQVPLALKQTLKSRLPFLNL